MVIATLSQVLMQVSLNSSLARKQQNRTVNLESCPSLLRLLSTRTTVSMSLNALLIPERSFWQSYETGAKVTSAQSSG